MRLRITDTRTLTDADPDVRELEFRAGLVSVGSASNNLVQLPDIAIAAHHANFEPSGDGWAFLPVVRDEKSKINDEVVEGRIELKDGDVLTIHCFELSIAIEPLATVVLPKPGKIDDLAMIRQYPLPPLSEVRKGDATISLDETRRKALAAFVSRLSRCQDLPSIMELVTTSLEAEFNAHTVWMGIRKEEPESFDFVDARRDGASTLVEPPNLSTYVYRCLIRQQFINVRRSDDEKIMSVLALPILGTADPMGMIYVDSFYRTRMLDKPELDFLTAVVAILTPFLESVLESSAGAQGSESSRDDVPATQQLYERSQPRTIPKYPKLELAYHVQRGAKGSVDVFDITKMPNGLLALIVGQVRAESVRSVVAVSQIQGAFRVAGLHADPPRVQLKALNWLLSDESDPCSLAAVIVVMNPKTGALEISSAGPIGAVLIDTDGTTRSLVDKTAPPVGNGKPVEYPGKTLKLGDGATLAFFSPGAVSAANDAGSLLGEKKLIELIGDEFGLSAQDALDDLLADVGPYFKESSVKDDITILLAHRPK